MTDRNGKAFVQTSFAISRTSSMLRLLRLASCDVPGVFLNTSELSQECRVDRERQNTQSTNCRAASALIGVQPLWSWVSLGSPAEKDARNLTKDPLSLFPLPNVWQDVPGTPPRRSQTQEQCHGLVKGSLLAPAVPAGGGNSREVGGGLVRLFVRLHSVSWP